jgi:hypothetical protein
MSPRLSGGFLDEWQNHRLDELLQRVLRKVAVLVVDGLDARAIHHQ